MESLNKDILTIIRAYINEDYDFRVDNSVSDILDKGNSCGIGIILAYALKKNNIYKEEGILDNILFYCAARNEKLATVRKQISSILESNGINFIFIKGVTIGKYYKEEFLRFSSDIDLLVEKNNYEKAKDILVNNGFSLFSSSLNELTLKSKDNVYVDLHCMFSQNQEEIEEVFKGVKFDNTHELSNEYKYIHSIYHAVKHLKENYISLQFLFDLYYLNKLNSDKKFINDALKKMGFDKFNDVTLQLIDYIVNGKEESDVVRDYKKFLINTANSKGIENKVLAGQQKNGNSIKYIVKRVFPNFKEMCRLYPDVKTNKILLPYYYAKRIVDRINQGQTNRAIKELNVSLNIDKNKVNKTKQLFDELGL